MKILISFLTCFFFTNFLFGNFNRPACLSSKSDRDIVNKNYSIVFVHIGPNLPAFLETSIQQAALFNKNAQIYLIADKENLKQLSFKIPLNNVRQISCESLTKTKQHVLFLKNTSLLGFWRYTTERFFYLSELILDYNLTNIFHLENDNMLYMDLEKHLSVFEENYPHMIAATFDSDQRCIGGFIYIADKTPISELCSFLTQQTPPSSNDMISLCDFKEKFYKVYIDHLPILFNSFAEENELINLLGKTTKNKYLYCNNFEQFNSIFDAAAIGQYLGGINNNRFEAGFINETCLFSPKKFSFEWHKDELNRLIPYIVYKNEKYRINNLHIHSKNLKAFYSLR